MGVAGGNGRRILAVAGSAALAIAIGWQLHPLLFWHLEIAPSLESTPHAERLRVETVTAFGSPPAGWTTLEVSNLSLRAPIRSSEGPSCRACSDRCLLQLEDGTLAIFDAPPPESYAEALDQLAPDEGDVSIFRSVARNWQSIETLAARARIPGHLPGVFRFRGPASRGVVFFLPRGDKSRFVIYAYAPDGTPTRVIGVTGVSDQDLRRTLGSLEVGSGGAAGSAETASGCEPGGAGAARLRPDLAAPWRAPRAPAPS